MKNPFQSPKQRVARANEHIQNLERRISKFFKKEPYARVVERDTEGVNDHHKIKLKKSMPEGFTSLAVEAVEGLRSALDQATYAVVALAGKKDSRQTYFPISEDAAELENVIKRRCTDVPADFVALFRSFKPYKGGNDLIWSLNKLCNTNKHKMIVPVGMMAAGMTFENFTLSGSGAIPSPRWDKDKDEMTFAIAGVGSEINYNVNFSFYVAFGAIEGIDGAPAVPVLKSMANEVQRIVLATEAEARKLGFL